MRPIVQISLDLIDLNEALATAEMALRAGVDWLEAGTPLILAHGTAGVRALRERWPDVPIVADLKIMDGGYQEAELMAKAGATHVVVMGLRTRRDDRVRSEGRPRFRRENHGRRHGRRRPPGRGAAFGTARLRLHRASHRLRSPPHSGRQGRQAQDAAGRSARSSTR
ncbi:MAG: orotidine 5'-phosphate decarboxylase [Pirellulales bacterium]